MPTVRPPIAAAELASILERPETRIVDCRFYLPDPERGRQEYLSGHIPGAAYADLDKDLSSPVTATSGRHPLPDPDDAARTVARLGISNDSRVIVYDDRSGAVASRLWWMLRWMGHDDVAVLDGGFAAWQAAGLPASTGDEATVPGAFVPGVVRDLVWTTDDVAEMVATAGEFLLVDARDTARYRGEIEPIDPVAGHVPGAVNLPFPASLTGAGAWREPAELAALWSSVPGIMGAQSWGVMCGSGVTACHLALSALLAGLPEPRLYAGSWSEWVRDPGRPVATGGGAR